MYSSSKGTISLGDLRLSSTCANYAKVFESPEDPASKTFFSEIIASISDANFSRDGRYIVSRDYMTLKIWDMKMEKKPMKVLNIHEGLRSKLSDLYENDCIFDKFETSFSPCGNYVMSGSYKNMFHVFDIQGKVHNSIEASKAFLTSAAKAKKLKSSFFFFIQFFFLFKFLTFWSKKTKKQPKKQMTRRERKRALPASKSHQAKILKLTISQRKCYI